MKSFLFVFTLNIRIKILNYCWVKNEIEFFEMKFFNMIFDYKNGCKNEFKDNNEKSWSKII